MHLMVLCDVVVVSQVNGLSEDDLSKAAVQWEKNKRMFLFTVDRIMTQKNGKRKAEVAKEYTAVCGVGSGSAPPGMLSFA